MSKLGTDCIKCKRWKLFNDEPCSLHPDFKTSNERLEAEIQASLDVLTCVAGLRVLAFMGQHEKYTRLCNELVTKRPLLAEQVVAELERLGPITEKEFQDSLFVALSPQERIQMTFDELAKKYCSRQQSDPEQLHAVLYSQAKKFNPKGWMLLECKQLDSSRCGEYTILPYGPLNTFKEPPTVPISLRGLASDMSVVVGFMTREEFQTK